MVQQEQLLQDEPQEAVENQAPPPISEEALRARIIIKFFSIWLSSLFALLIIALLSNIEWARRHIETSLSQSFHRQVHLGKLSWTLGWQGLAIDTDKFEMKEEDGNPFISSGHSEIGIAVLPLLEKKLVVKHLEFEKPEVWAVQTSQNKWNFSDLLTEGPEIHMVQIEQGQLHLRNKVESSENQWNAYDARDIKLSLNLPRGNRNWPFFLSGKVQLQDGAGKPFETDLRLSATGRGEFKNWQENKYNIDLQVQKLDFEQFRPLIKKMPKIRGLCNLKLTGEGVFKQGFVADAQTTLSNLKIPSVENNELEIEKAVCKSKLLIDPENIEWNHLKLTLGDWELDSAGKFVNWQKEEPAYEAKVGGKLTHLKDFFSKVITHFMPDQADPHKEFTNVKLDKICTAEKNGELCGSAIIELHLKGDKDSHNVATNIKADGIPLAQLVDQEMGSNLLDAFKIDPKVPIKGEISIDPGKKLILKDLEIPIEDSKIILSGNIEQDTGKTLLDFKAEKLSFDTFKKRLGTDNPVVKAICSGTAKSKPYSVAGTLDIKGQYTFDGKTPDVSADVKLRGLKLTRQDSSQPSCSGIKGDLSYHDGQIDIKQVSGVTAGGVDGPAGDFVVNGTYAPQSSNRTNIEFNAHEVSIAQLKDWLTRFGVNLQQPVLDKLAGDLNEIKAHVSVRNGVPITTFSINPEDLIINLSNRPNEASAQQFKLSSGAINYDGSELSASEVLLSSKGGKLVLNASMTGKLDAIKLKWARIKTDGFELADLQSMFKGNFGGGKNVRSQLPEFMTPSSSSYLHGKVYGDMQFTGEGLSGVLGFNNAGGKFGKGQTTVDKLSGVAVISKDQVVFQDTAGQLGKSTFFVDGVISNYATANMSWQGQLRGNFYPSEVDSIMNNLGHGIGLDSDTSEALNLRVTGNGDKKNVSLTFRGRASHTYGAALKTAFGTMHQPKNRPLNFNGGLSLDQDKSELSLSSFQLTAGNELLTGNASFKWANETAERPASLAFALNTPNPIKTATLMEIIWQNNSAPPASAAGTSQLNLKVEGPINDLVLSGHVVVDKSSLPGCHMDNLSGRIDLPGWHLNRTSGSDETTSIAKLQLKTITTAGISMKDLNATVLLDAANRMLFKDCQASISGGKLTLSGYLNMQTQAYHADVSISKLVVDELVKDLIDHSGGVTGLADVSLSLDNNWGADTAKSLSGSGQFNVYQGTVASFGKLQEKLNEANLLQQGLFGFNVNNLLQAMMPVKSGQFNEVSGKFTLGKGELNFEQVRFEGNNLRMRAAGSFNYISKTVDMDVAGDIPRVSSSIIPGAIGEMSRKVTLQRMFRIVTFKKLKDLPALPLLGDIANDDPRAFRFSVQTSAESPKLLTQAAEKSFKWLPNKPFASAHPVPGI